MAINVMTQVWAVQGITTAQKFVLLAIADCANDEGTAYPSINKIAKKCSIDPRNVRVHLKALVEVGLLTSETQLRGNGSQTVNFYQLTLTPPPDEIITLPLMKSSPPPDEIITPPLMKSSPLEPSLEPEPSLETSLAAGSRQQAGESAPEESFTAKRIRAVMVTKRDWLLQRYPAADLELETEELVAKYHDQNLGADPWLVILRWFRNLKDRPARAAPAGGGVTMAEALEMFPIKGFGGKRGSAKD